MFEHFFQCPYCWEEISMFLEPFPGEQSYVEDCEVCCRPIHLTYFYDKELEHFSAQLSDEEQ